MQNNTFVKNVLVFTCRCLRVIVIPLVIFSIWRFDYLQEAAPVALIKLVAPVIPNSMVRLHVVDEAGILPQADILKFEEYLEWIFQESDIDFRFVFVPEIVGKTIEELAVEKVESYGIGGKSREERGVLLLYDLQHKEMRIEVGYGLEEYFTDAFVSYLMNDHTRDFFASGDMTTGLRLLIRMLHHNIREAVLGRKFDPRLLDIIRPGRYLSGGAGATDIMPEKGEKLRTATLEAVQQQEYPPQPTPRETYEKYLAWLASGRSNPRHEMFTDASQNVMASLPMTKAYFHYILMQEYGREYEIDIRDNLALLYFTNDPLVSPHFFIKTAMGWQMDIASEVGNTRNRVGGIYTWDYGGRNDKYSKTFSDRLVIIKNYIRIDGGDNRQLPIRNSS